MKLADTWIDEPPAPTQEQLYDELDEYDEIDESKDGSAVCPGGSACLRSLVRATECCSNLLEKFEAKK